MLVRKHVVHCRAVMTLVDGCNGVEPHPQTPIGSVAVFDDAPKRDDTHGAGGAAAVDDEIRLWDLDWWDWVRMLVAAVAALADAWLRSGCVRL